MALKINDLGTGNIIKIGEDVLKNGDGTLIVRGSNNLVEIGSGTKLARVILEVRNDRSEMRIGRECRLTGKFRCIADDTHLIIGELTTSVNVRISLMESGAIIVGKDCMFSGDIHMDVSDVHSIINLETGKRINPPKNIVIGDHVWIGQGVFITKGVRIGSNSVIGAKSVVTKDVPPNCIAAGIPAKIMRRGITWDRKRLPDECK
jgi:acetyltransferase-like isoleucine patch superfamily enzyme